MLCEAGKDGWVECVGSFEMVSSLWQLRDQRTHAILCMACFMMFMKIVVD